MHAMLSVDLSWKLAVAIGDNQWVPRKRQTIDDDQTFALVGVMDFGLIKALTNGDCPKSVARPSLRNTIGFHELLKERNTQQAEHMQSPPQAIENPIKRLFGTPSDDQPKKKRRKAQELKDARASPSCFDVSLPAVGAFPGASVTMLRPVKSNDEVWVLANNACISAVVNFVLCHGVQHDILLSKRDYTRKDKGDDAEEGGAEHEIEEHTGDNA